jgi:predicted transcriptional regulator
MKECKTTREMIFDYLCLHPASTLSEIAQAVNLVDAASVRYHLRILANDGKIELPAGKHRQYKIVEAQ